MASLERSPKTRLVLETLIERACTFPHHGPMIPGTFARVLRSMPHGELPALQLIYRVRGEAVYLYFVEPSDVLAGVPRGSA